MILAVTLALVAFSGCCLFADLLALAWRLLADKAATIARAAAYRLDCLAKATRRATMPKWQRIATAQTTHGGIDWSRVKVQRDGPLLA